MWNLYGKGTSPALPQISPLPRFSLSRLRVYSRSTKEQLEPLLEHPSLLSFFSYAALIVLRSCLATFLLKLLSIYSLVILFAISSVGQNGAPGRR